MTGREALIRAGREIAGKGLTWASSGNLSVREAGEVIVTAGGAVLGALAPEDLVSIRAAGGRRPSKEAPMHMEIYRRRPDVGAVVHASPFYTTLCASAEIPLQDGLFVEAVRLRDRTAWVNYFPPGSAALAEAAAEAAERADVLILRNHGILACGAGLREALDALEVTEAVCRMSVLAKLGRFQLRPLPEGEALALADGYLRRERDG